MQLRASLVIAAGLLTVTLLSGCAAPPEPRVSAIPDSLQNLALDSCFQQLDTTKVADLSIQIGGSGGSSTWVEVGAISATGFDPASDSAWHVRAKAGRTEFYPGADDAALPSGDDLARAEEVASDLLSCASRYRFQAQSEFPASRAALLQLYRYDLGVLWPCLTAHGVMVGTAPPRRAFLTQVDAYAAYPVPPSASNVEVERRLAAAAACPAIPQYLARR
jgi:hypothetical protein